MKVSAIHPHVLRTRLEAPFAFSQGWVTERAAVVVEVVTDTGLVGWGEALCLAHGIEVNPHVWGAGVAQHASLHLIASLPVANPSLFQREPVFEYDCSDHPFRSALVDHPVSHVDGWIEIDDRPGLGVDVDRVALRRFAAD